MFLMLCCVNIYSTSHAYPYCDMCQQAGETIGQADSQDGSQGYDTWSNERLSQWLVAVVESPSAGATGAARGIVELGVVAVETSTGAVQYSQFRQALCFSPTCKAHRILCWVLGAGVEIGARQMVRLPYLWIASTVACLHRQST